MILTAHDKEVNEAMLALLDFDLFSAYQTNL